MHAALINGISSHVFDFDDTDLTSAVHPSAPVLPVLLALEQRGMSGRDFVTAMVLGFEAECRITRAVQPKFGAVGWHPTGAAGVFGAAIAAAKVLGLDEARLSARFARVTRSCCLRCSIQFSAMKVSMCRVGSAVSVKCSQNSAPSRR